jgi:hypothetical protein
VGCAGKAASFAPPPKDDLETFLSDPFHNCSLRAYVEVWEETDQWPPDSEEVRKRAYLYYEQLKKEEANGNQPA